MKAETDFKPGETCLYYEDGGVTRCRVVEVTRDKPQSGHVYMILEAMGTIQESTFHGPMDPGHVFSASKKVGERQNLLWNVEEDCVLTVP